MNSLQRKRAELIASAGPFCPVCSRLMWSPKWEHQPRTGKPQRCATIDHITPRSKGGSNKKENLRVICAGCNAHRKDGLVFPPNLGINLEKHRRQCPCNKENYHDQAVHQD